MTTTINASPTNGIVQTADGSGIMKLQSNGVTTNALAWVNWAGTTGTIRSSYNVSSVTRNATGDYTVTFSTAMVDANYASIGSTSTDSAPTQAVMIMDFSANSNAVVAPTTSAIRVSTTALGASKDVTYASLAIFGN